MLHERINHRAEVSNLAELMPNRSVKMMLTVDINHWGITSPFSDPENSTIRRQNLFSLSTDTMPEDHINEGHYPNASYGSIWDY
jgi:hypothetical protein